MAHGFGRGMWKKRQHLGVHLCCIPQRASHPLLAPKRHCPCFWSCRAEEQLTWYVTPVLVSPTLLVRSFLCTKGRERDSGRLSKQKAVKKPVHRRTLCQVLVLTKHWWVAVSSPRGSAVLWVASSLGSTHPSPLAVPTLHPISLVAPWKESHFSQHTSQTRWAHPC